MRRAVFTGFVSLLCLAGSSSLFAGPQPLKQARVDEISGEVALRKDTEKSERKATVNDVVAGSDIIRTGKKSRAELEFADKSICRLGSNTIFSFDPNSRDMAFARGIAVVHVPPGQGGARIATPAATAAIQGDTLVVRAVVMPDGKEATQFTALSPKGGPTDGNIIITLNNNPGESFRLEGGHFAVVPKDATSVSQVPRAEIDVGNFAKTSPILQDLPQSARREMKMVTDRQLESFNSGAAQRTDMAIVGTQVVKADASGSFGLPSPGGLPPPPDGSIPPPTGTTAPLVDGTFDASLGGLPPPPGSSGTLDPLAGSGGGLMGSTQQSFTQVVGSTIMPPPPPGGTMAPAFAPPVFVPLTLAGAVTIDTMAGTITGAAANQFSFVQGGGVGLFGFDRLTLNGANITVQGSNVLFMQGQANSPTAGVGNSISITGASTFTFQPGSAPFVSLDAVQGDVAITANLTANGANVNVISRQGTVTMAGSSINTSAATSPAPGGNVTIISQGNATIKQIVTTGGAGTPGSPNASPGGNINIQSNSGAVNLAAGVLIDSKGGNTAIGGAVAGTGGQINITGTAITPSTGLITANGGAAMAGATGPGISGNVNLTSTGGGTTTFVGGLTISADAGASANATSPGVAGGLVRIASAGVSIPTGVTITALGNANTAAGPSGAGGTVLVLANTAAGVSVAGSGTPTLSANAGATGGVQGAGGLVGLGAPAGPNITVAGSGTVVSATGATAGTVKVTNATNVGGGLTNPAPTVGSVP